MKQMLSCLKGGGGQFADLKGAWYTDAHYDAIYVWNYLQSYHHNAIFIN